MTSTPARTSWRSTWDICGESSPARAAPRRSRRSARWGTGSPTVADRFRIRGLRSRLAIAIAAILVAAVGLTFAIIYRGTGSTLRAELDTELRDEARAFDNQGLAGATTPAELAAHGRRYIRAQGFGPSSRLLILTIAGGPVVTNSPELLGLRRDLDRENPALQSREDAQGRRLLHSVHGFSSVRLEDIGNVRMITRPVTRGGARVATVRVGESLAPVERAQDGVAKAFVLAGLFTLAAALAAGYLVASRTAGPLRRMARTAAAVDAGDISHRIGATSTTEEIRTLSEAFDHMLDRLDDAFARQHEFVSDASHELRTPLTVIRGQLEVLARSPEVTREDVRRVEKVVSKEVSRMEGLVDDLLLLARTEEVGRLSRRAVDTGAFLREQVDAVAPTADRSFKLGAVAEGTVQADPDALTQAIRNLTRTATEHTDAGGSIRLSSHSTDGRIQFAVEDDGPGIPATERTHAFERFHRVRPTTTQGSGLGLAIVRAIAQAHDGRAWIEEAQGGGARVAIELPGFTPSHS